MNIGYVICEGLQIEPDAKIVQETSKRVIAEATVMVSEFQNRNGRLYKDQDVEREFFHSPRTKELLKTGFFGECGHPQDQSLMRQQTIDPGNVILQYLSFSKEGNTVKTRMKGTNNALGDMIDANLREGLLPALSIRALGTIAHRGGVSVVENFRLICPDYVIYPSFPQAYTEKIVSESANLADGFTSKTNQESGLLIPITNDSVISYIKSESCNLNSMFNNFDIFYESIKVINNGSDVQLMDKTGNLFVVNLENYISNEIMNYCYKD